MIKNEGGSIINTITTNAYMNYVGNHAYGASKGGVKELTRSMCLDYAKYNIRVNSIHPGYIWTPMVENSLKAGGGDLEQAKKLAGEAHPLGHMGEPIDIAYGALYLASDESKFVTGSELVIDGGYTAR